eukprot:3634113-Amphidinium_carterae.1
MSPYFLTPKLTGQKLILFTQATTNTSGSDLPFQSPFLLTDNNSGLVENPQTIKHYIASHRRA